MLPQVFLERVCLALRCGSPISQRRSDHHERGESRNQQPMYVPGTADHRKGIPATPRLKSWLTHSKAKVSEPIVSGRNRELQKDAPLARIVYLDAYG